MTEEILAPISNVTAQAADFPEPIGRRADRLAMMIAGLGFILSIIGAAWFFLGFVENDTRPEHLTSAFLLTFILFSFAALPFALVTYFARRAHRIGAARSHLICTLFLMLPWVGLGSLAVSHTPLPFWSGLIAVNLSGLLCIWALISIILDWRDRT